MHPAIVDRIRPVGTQTGELLLYRHLDERHFNGVPHQWWDFSAERWEEVSSRQGFAQCVFFICRHLNHFTSLNQSEDAQKIIGEILEREPTAFVLYLSDEFCVFRPIPTESTNGQIASPKHPDKP